MKKPSCCARCVDAEPVGQYDCDTFKGNVRRVWLCAGCAPYEEEPKARKPRAVKEPPARPELRPKRKGWVA